jgi:hypothetical protein
MSLRDVEATGATTLTSSRLRTAGVHLRNTSGLDREGIARAQQIAAIATGDTRRQQIAEHALAACLSDPAQLSQITGTSLCHGWAGVYQTAARAACDALTPQISTRLPHLAAMLTRHPHARREEGPGLLEGQAGVALALHTAAHTAPISGWDTCLMIS